MSDTTSDAKGSLYALLEALKASVEASKFEKTVDLCETLVDELIVLSNDDDNENNDGDNGHLALVVCETYLKALLQLKRFEVVVEKMGSLSAGGSISVICSNSHPTKKSKSSNSKVSKNAQPSKFNKEQLERLEPLHAYALYRLEHYEQVKSMVQKRGGTGATLQHLLAQALYNTANTPKAIDAYEGLLDELDGQEQDEHLLQEHRMEVLTNLMAVLGANATPYVGLADERLNDLALQANNLLENHRDNNDYPYDLALNLASWQVLMAGHDRAQLASRLQRAQQHCIQVLESERASSEEIQKEIAPLIATRTWSRIFWGDLDLAGEEIITKGHGSAPTPVETLQTLNHSLTATTNDLSKAKQHDNTLLERLDSFPDDWKMTPLQARLWYYNRAIAHLRTNNLDECRQACNQLRQSLDSPSTSKNRKQKAGSTSIGFIPTPTNADKAWWNTRIDVLLAHAMYQEGKGSSSPQEDLKKVLEERRTHLETMQASPAREQSLLYLRLHMAALLSQSSTGALALEEAVRFLQVLRDSYPSRPGLLSSLALLLQQQGQHEASRQVLLQSGNDLAVADFALARKNYGEAVALLESKLAENGDDPMVRAKLALALSYTDAKRAHEVWASHRNDANVHDEENVEKDLETKVSADDLERRELPRLKSVSKVAVVTAAEGAIWPAKSKKSKASVLRRRARKRDSYLNQLQEKGLYRPDRPVKPDVERWIPKHERAHSRRRRNNANTKGAQGGVSAKDAAKLDVAARASGDVELSGPSTANKPVASSSGPAGRRGGRRR